MARKNPIERRLDILQDQWVEFAEQQEARMLRWLITPDERQMIDAFLQKEEDEQAGELPDLFLPFEDAFEQPAAHGRILLKTLVEWWEHDREELVKSDGGPVWAPPRLNPQQSDTEAFAKACASLQQHYAEVCELLVSVLTPERVSDPAQYQLWLQRLLHVSQSEAVRFIVLDDAECPRFDALARAELVRVKSVRAELDMSGALRELAQGVSDSAEPGGQFRERFLQIGEAAKAGDLAQVRRLGEEAVALVEPLGWHHLVVAARFTVGAAVMAKQPLEAHALYVQAEASAARAEAEGQEYGKGLRLKCRMAQGSALVTAEQWLEAAAAYQGAAPLARELKDALMELESLRMASYCFERGGQDRAAWEHGLEAWKVVQGMDDTARANSTAPYLAEALTRLTQKRRYRDHAERWEREISAQLGKDWRKGKPLASPLREFS